MYVHFMILPSKHLFCGSDEIIFLTLLMYSHVSFMYSHVSFMYSHVSFMYSHVSFMYSHVSFMYSHVSFMYSHVSFMYSHVSFMYSHVSLISLVLKVFGLINENVDYQDILLYLVSRWFPKKSADHKPTGLLKTT